MPFPASFLDELNNRNPIEDVVGQYVSLTRKGSNLFGLCPFHSEKTPSFSVAPDKGIYYCFGCHKGGGVINFIMEIESLSYPDAVRFLAKRAGLEVPEDEQYQSQYQKQERLWALCKDAARFFHQKLLEPCGEQARAYIIKRGLSKATVTRFGLGFSPNEWSSLLDTMTGKGYSREEILEAGLAVSGKNGGMYDRFRNRLMFPIIDIRGNIIGFGGRVMDDSTPKYLNSPETLIFNKRKNLFALNIARKSKQGRIILTEGYMDAISLHQYGFDCAVASLGTSLTEEHANILAKYTDQVVLTYDGDEAGQNATRRAIPMLEKTGIQVKVLRMQGAKDPDEYIKTFGADAFRNLLEQSENHIDYRLGAVQRKYDLQIDEQRVAFVKEAAGIVAELPGSVEREVYAMRVAETAGMPAAVVTDEVQRQRKRRLSRARKEQERDLLRPATAMQPPGRSIRFDDPRSAAAEQGIIRLLYLDPGLFYGRTNVPDAAQFSSPELRHIYTVLLAHGGTGTVQIAALSGELAPDELALLTGIIQQPAELSNGARALDDYISILQTQSSAGAAVSEADLLAFANKLKEHKGYGGKDGTERHE